MTTPSDIIERWPSAEHFAADIGLKYPSYARVMKMRQRIPEKFWDAAVGAARARGIDLSREALEAAHAPPEYTPTLPADTTAQPEREVA